MSLYMSSVFNNAEIVCKKYMKIKYCDGFNRNLIVKCGCHPSPTVSCPEYIKNFRLTSMVPFIFPCIFSINSLRRGPPRNRWSSNVYVIVLKLKAAKSSNRFSYLGKISFVQGGSVKLYSLYRHKPNDNFSLDNPPH